MVIKGVGIGRGVAVGPVIRMAAALPEPSDAPRADSVSAESEIERVTKSLALVNADLKRETEITPCEPATLLTNRRCRAASTCRSQRARNEFRLC